METGKFYYIKDNYYQRFSMCSLMGNKERDEYGKHGRPCFYCFQDEGYYWMIPISSKVDKYKKLYQEKIKRYPDYDGIRFGYVNGQYRAFLIQNACPVTPEYIESEYRIENNSVPVTINLDLASELNGLMRKVIRLYKKGIKIVITDLDYILNELSKDAAE